MGAPISSISLLLVAATACGATAAPTPSPPAEAKLRVPPAPAPVAQRRRSTDDEAGEEERRACVARASTAPFAPFTAPVANDEFRAHLAARVGELRCCFTAARLEALEGTRVQLSFIPRTDDPDDGATVTLDSPLDVARPAERRCLLAITGQWIMTPSPLSDLVRTPLDPRAASRTSTAALRAVYPL